MSALGRFERFMESIVEGSARRLFRSRITAAEITRRLERAMESQQTITVDRIIVPSFYRAYLNPEDFQAFAAIQRDLEQEMGMYLLELAQDRGFTLLQHPVVNVVPDPSTPSHSIRVEAEMMPQPPGPQRASQGGGHVPTQVMAPQGSNRAAPAAAPANPELLLHSSEGVYRFPLKHNPTMIGRGLDNDIVLDDPRVSRRHAEIWRDRGHYMIADQGSTNGTYVNGAPAGNGLPLQPGDVISLGGLELVLQ